MAKRLAKLSVVFSSSRVEIEVIWKRCQMDMTTNTRQVSGVTIVGISGRIVLGKESAVLRRLVFELLTTGIRKFCSTLAMSGPPG